MSRSRDQGLFSFTNRASARLSSSPHTERDYDRPFSNEPSGRGSYVPVDDTENSPFYPIGRGTDGFRQSPAGRYGTPTKERQSSSPARGAFRGREDAGGDRSSRAAPITVRSSSTTAGGEQPSFIGRLASSPKDKVRQPNNALAFSSRGPLRAASAQGLAPSANYYDPQTAELEELTKRITALNTRLATVEEREVEGMNTVSRNLDTTRQGIDKMGVIIANLETKLSKDMCFLEDSIGERLAEEERIRVEAERDIRKLVKEEIEAFRRSTLIGGKGMGIHESTESGGAGTNKLHLGGDSTYLRARGEGSPTKADENESVRGWEQGGGGQRLHHVRRQQDTELSALSSKIESLGDTIDERAYALQQELESSIKELQRSVKGLLGSLDLHKKRQEESERSLVQVVEEMTTALMKEIADERRQRAESHKHLERVLLEAASRQFMRA